MGDIRVTGISDAEDTNAEELTAGSTQFDVVTSVVVDTNATQHGVVFDFRTTKRRAVGADDDELSLSLTNALQGGLETQAVLTALHDESEASVNGFNTLLLLKTID